MIGKSVFIWAASVLGVLVCSVLTLAQPTSPRNDNDPARRIKIAPESVFTMFREAGMKPVNHELTPAQSEQVSRAFSRLPPLHQRLLRQHLHSISFMDNMPNTALTSLLDSGNGPKQFNITFRAGLLDETISEWASWKENSCFNRTADSSYAMRVEGGSLDALLYVLLHEATHVVDAVMGLTPPTSERHALIEPTPFTKDIWRTMNAPVEKYTDLLLEQTRFRSGRPMAISMAPDVYRKLAQTPFPSLYGMAAWSEDIAELVTIYHLTTHLNQPFYVAVTKNNVEVARFEPMKNPLVKPRLKQLATFYAP